MYILNYILALLLLETDEGVDVKWASVAILCAWVVDMDTDCVKLFKL